MMAKIVVFEGIDRLGKTTQTKLLVDRLNSKGKRVTYVKSPYNEGLTYKLIYWMLRNSTARKVPNLFQVVHFVNKIYFQVFKLPGLLKNNDYVVMDRWIASMLAYGIADNASTTFTNFLASFIKVPDVTVLMRGTPFSRDEAEDSYEADKEYQARVKSLYDAWAVNYRGSIIDIDANQTVQKVSDDILDAISLHSDPMEIAR